MSKRKSVSKLFAVVALSLAGCEEATPPAVTPQVPVAGETPTAMSNVGVAKPPAPATPRTLPNGRPACGNVMGKAPPPPECIAATQRKPQDWKKFCFVASTRTCIAGNAADKEVWDQLPAALKATIRGGTAATPRTLPDGAPAPGNVTSRAAAPKVLR